MNITFKWIGGATWILQIDSVKIACDPVLCSEGHVQDYKYFKTTRLNSPVYNESDFKNVNLWLLTHNHEDHIDSKGFEMIENDSVIISHKSLKSLFKNNIHKHLRFLKRNDESEISVDGVNINVKAVPAVHAKKSFLGNMVGNGNGYILEITRSILIYRIYITGDSVYNKKLKKNVGYANIDLIIANSGSAMAGRSLLSRIIGRITNNTGDIKKMNTDLNPGMIIPVHWGTFSHYSEIITDDSFKGYDNIKIINPGEIIELF